LWGLFAKYCELGYYRLEDYLFKTDRRELSDQVKVKAIPLQALTGPEGSRRSRLPDFKTIGT
jgi:hypothetical protein